MFYRHLKEIPIWKTFFKLIACEEIKPAENWRHLHRHLKKHVLLTGNRCPTGSTVVLREGIITRKEN